MWDNPRFADSYLKRLAIARLFPNLQSLFEQRNYLPFKIEGLFADDVVLVPTPTPPSSVTRLYEPGLTVLFSAPFYPDTDVAVVYYNRLFSENGVIHLERNVDRWEIRDVQGGIQ